MITGTQLVSGRTSNKMSGNMNIVFQNNIFTGVPAVGATIKA
jgi:hypothetical protein